MDAILLLRRLLRVLGDRWGSVLLTVLVVRAINILPLLLLLLLPLLGYT